MAIKQKNYLNNQDLLAEIHRSKNSFSSYTQPHYHQYDVIVSSVDEIPYNIQSAREAQAKRLSKAQYEAAVRVNDQTKQTEHVVSAQDIQVVDLIFRVMTYDHIPLDSERKRNPKSTADHYTKLNFPPFQHWKYDENGFLRCVGKSHWKGPVETGEFCKTHGKPTDKLALMWMKLCERYGSKGNIRSYTYNDEMQGQALLQLVEVGLQFNEAKSNNPFSYSTTVIGNSFIRVLNGEKTNQIVRDEILEANDMDPSYTYQHQYEWDAALRRNLTDYQIERMTYVQKGCNVHRSASRGKG